MKAQRILNQFYPQTRGNRERGMHNDCFHFCKSRGWHEVCDKYVPCLASRDVETRREWAEKHLNYAWFGSGNLRYPRVKDDWKVAWIDIAEKWFYVRTRKKRKLHSEQEKPRTAASPSVTSTRSWDPVPSGSRKETSTVFLEYIGALKRRKH